MAEVIANELGSSNGEVSEENDDIKLNGDSCDDFSSTGKNSPQSNDSQISKEEYSTKKLPGQEVHGAEKAYEQAQLNEKNRSISMANGRVKPQPSAVHDNGGNGEFDDDEDDADAELGDGAERPHCGPSLVEKPPSICTDDMDNTELGDSDDDAIESEKNTVNDAHCDSDKADSAAAQSDAKTTEYSRVETSAIVQKYDSSSVEKRIFTALKDSISISISTCGSRDKSSGNANDVVVDMYTRDENTAAELHAASGMVSRIPSLGNDANTGEKKTSGEDGNETRNHRHHNDKNSDNNNDDEDDEIISISSTPDKAKKIGKKPSLSVTNITPRRSSRNLNKQKSYAEKDTDFEENASATGKKRSAGGEDDEIEEVTPTDPLADEPRSKMRNKTIVVSDTKGLVEFASNAKASRSNKKEPTLVIIDTNSILSGRGPIPVSQQSSTSSLLHSSSSSAPIPVSLPIPAGAFASATRGASPSSASAFSVIPIGLPAQGMYSQFKNPPPQIKPIVVGPASTTVTAVSLPTTVNSASATTITTVSATSSTTVKQPPVILPSLTDDMFVVEAPSFIVPYVYEKPPMKSLKEHIEKIQSDMKEAEDNQRKQQEEKERVQNEKNAEEAKNAQVDEKDAKTEDADQDTATDIAANIEEKEKSALVKKESADPPMEVDSEAVESNAAVSASTVTATADVVSAGAGANANANAVVVKKTDVDKKDETQPGIVKEIEKKTTAVTDDSKKPISYFDNPLGKFFMQIGLNLVQEHVQTDLLRSQKRKRDKEGSKCSQDVHSAIDELTKTLESSKENNDPFKLELKKCELCSFKTESLLVMAHHLETPHMKNYTYRCNFCPLEVRSPHDILFHMEAEHNIRGRLERAPAFHQCPNCPFEDNQKGKLTRHLISCSKKYRPERNQEPPLDWEPPAKIPRVTRNRPPSMSPGNAVYQAAMSGLKQVPQNTLLPKLMPNTTNMKHTMLSANKRPNIGAGLVNRFPNAGNQPNFQQRPISVQTSNQGMMFRTGGGTNSQTQVLLPQGYQLSGAQIYQQNQSTKSQSQQQSLAAAKLLNQPSISITPLPRQTSTQASTSANSATTSNLKPGKPVTGSGGKNTFVVCEICDGYIKDLEQLRNHMQWIHKVKIHPKMIYNRPPLNCQKCQFRFFTDQGLERHLLGSHGLVTSSMQEAANKGKDGGRCPVCGRVYQWKLLNHVARDHQMALKPAHLSYKCTVCTATFGMYKQFESHVYSAHSVVAKRAMDTTKKPPSSQTTSSQNDTLLKPLKINDEITIIPQPVRATKPASKSANATTITATLTSNKGKSDEDEQSCKRVCSMEDFSSNEKFQRHVCEQHLKPFKIQISRIDLKSYNKIPNKENAFKLTRGAIIADELKSKFDLKDFYIAIKRHSINVDFRYKIVSNDEMDAMHSIPELVYSDVDENDTETRKNRSSLESNTLFTQRMMQRCQMSSATSTARKQKRRIPNGCRNAKRPTKTINANSSPSSSDVDIVEESSSANNNFFDQFNDSTHFLLDSARNFTPMISSQNRSSVSTSSVRQTAHQLICVSRTVTTSQTSNVPSPHQHVNVSAGKSSLTVINRQTVTTSSSMTFGGVGPRPTTQSRAKVRTANVYNPTLSSNRPVLGHSNSTFNGGVLFSRQRSTKITRRITSFAKPTPSTVSSNKQNDVISLLSDSDSDSDDGVVEIIETDNDANDSNDVYILPT